MLLVQSEYFVLLEFTLEHYIVVDLKKKRNKLEEPTASSSERVKLSLVSVKVERRRVETLESSLMHVLVYSSKNQEKSQVTVQHRNQQQENKITESIEEEEEEEKSAAHAGTELVILAPRNDTKESDDPRRY